MASFQNSIPGNGWGTARPVFQLGRNKTLAVPMEVHKENRTKVVEGFAAKGITTGVVFMKGGEQMNQYDTDIEPDFRYVTEYNQSISWGLE